MAFASTRTHLSLDRWAALIGINPAHLNSVIPAGRHPTVCEQPWMQFAYQAVDRVGREEVAMAIAQAESDIEHHLGYRLLPSWEVDEWHGTMRPYQREMYNLNGADIRGQAQLVKTKWGHVISGGIRSKELIANRPIVAGSFTDTDGDGYKETVTVTATVVAGQSPCEVCVYYPAKSADDRWEVRPINVSVAGTSATITFRREQIVKEELLVDLVPPADDSHLRGVADEDTSFLASVDVYRVYNDPQSQVTFLWEPMAGGCSCNGSGCGACAYSSGTGCLMIRDDPRLGLVSYHPAVWNGTTLEFDAEAWCRAAPDITRLYYYAGLRDKTLDCPTRQMDPEWERIVAYYAAALLDRPICECNSVHSWVAHWQYDFAISGADEQANQIPASVLDNPLGTTRGAVFAWRRILREGQAVGKVVYA